MDEEKKKKALANSAKYLFSNIPSDELKKVPLNDRKELVKLIEKYSNSQVINLNSMDDLDISMLIALLKKYILDSKQNKKMDELISFINKYNN